VAEYVITATMLLLRGAYQSTPDVASPASGRAMRWAVRGRETAGKTLGIIGFGSIGQLTGRLARGLGMNVIAFDAMIDDDAPACSRTAASRPPACTT
jgi:(S)-sulfolactate dehydrogenase